MRSATGSRPVQNPDRDSDLTARARIRDAGIALFGRLGYNGAGVRAIAAEAGVSPALVLHHFGSKEGLREACDEHVSAVMHEAGGDPQDSGAADPLMILRSVKDAQPLLRYLARMVVDGSPGVARMVDTMVEDAVAFMDEGVRAGALRPTAHPRERAVLLSIWQLGALALHEHVKRLLDLDLLGDQEALLRWGEPALEVLTHGFFADERWEKALEEAKNQREGGKP